MWPKRSYILNPLKEVASGSKGGKLIWNDTLEDYFKELKRMVSAETLLSYTYWDIIFPVHTHASDKQLVAVISQNNKPMVFFSRNISKPQCNYTSTKKEMM